LCAFGVKCSFAPGNALNDQTRGLVYQDCHR
jgi:hypothetical protein